MENKLTIEIYGQKYTIKGREKLEHLKEVANYVDEKIKQISLNNPRLDTSRLAVLSALNIADEYIKLKREYEEMLTLIETEKL